jgi:outer membrane protein OmpA-like peptidoglycan-associated protein
VEADQAPSVEPARVTRPQPPAPVTARPIQPGTYELNGQQRRLRAELLAQLNSTLETRDTPRGLVVTVPDSMFEPGESATLRPAAEERLMRIAAGLKGRSSLGLRVEGFSDKHDTGDVSRRRAESVREALVRDGCSAGLVAAAGYGDSRPITSNATAAGHEQNRRVEIDIAGSSIGEMPLWDRAYSLKK